MSLNLLQNILPLVLVVFFVLFVLKKILGALKAPGGIQYMDQFQVLEVQVPKFETSGRISQASALAAESMFASLHGLLREDYDLQEHFSFEISSDGSGGLKFHVVVPTSIIEFIKSQLYAQYPTALLSTVSDYTATVAGNDIYEVACLNLSKEQFFPIKVFRDFEMDSLPGITSALCEVTKGEKVWLQILVKPIPDVWQEQGYKYVESVRGGSAAKMGESMLDSLYDIFAGIIREIGGFFVTFISSVIGGSGPEPTANVPISKGPGVVTLSPVQELELKAIENKLSKMGFSVQMRILAASDSYDRVKRNLRSVFASFQQFQNSYSNSFTADEAPNRHQALVEFKGRAFNESQAFVLSVEEIASVFHLPSGDIETPNLSWIYSKKSEPPAMLPTTDCTYIGETIFRSKKVRFGIKDGDDRLRHLYLIGKSGTGKSTMLENMISQDIQKGFGVGVLDPHGETIEKVLERIPDYRVDDVVIVDPSDTQRPVGINLLEMEDLSQKNLMASALVSAIKQHFDYSWGPRLEYLLNYAILTLLEVPGTTMLGITRLLEDDNYLKYILHNVSDPVVLKFWNTEYKGMKGNQRLVTEAIAPIQNKVNRFLASTTIRNILGQRRSTIDFWNIMNSGKILLMNLSKGKVGEDNANLLGALLVSRLQFMALQRARIPYEDRNPFYLYVDEFQNFATGSFESVLSESRKYKLGLYLTHQYTAQLPEPLLKAVFGNVGTIAAFALGAPDARALSTEFAPFFDENDIISLERFHIYIKLMIDGMTSLPFSAKILLPWDPETSIVPRTNNKERVLELSRQKYGVDVEYVTSKINKWTELRFDKGMAIAEEHRRRRTQEDSIQ